MLAVLLLQTLEYGVGLLTGRSGRNSVFVPYVIVVCDVIEKVAERV